MSEPVHSNRITRQVERGCGPSPGQRRQSSKVGQNSWGEVEGSISLGMSQSQERLLKYILGGLGLISGGKGNLGDSSSRCRRTGTANQALLPPTITSNLCESLAEDAVLYIHPSSSTGDYSNLTSDYFVWDLTSEFLRIFYDGQQLILRLILISNKILQVHVCKSQVVLEGIRCKAIPGSTLSLPNPISQCQLFWYL